MFKTIHNSQRKRGDWSNYHFMENRQDNITAPFNEMVIGRMFRKMHYLTQHAPDAVQKQHKNMAFVWQKKFSSKLIRFSNNHTIERFI